MTERNFLDSKEMKGNNQEEDEVVSKTTTTTATTTTSTTSATAASSSTVNSFRTGRTIPIVSRSVVRSNEMVERSSKRCRTARSQEFGQMSSMDGLRTKIDQIVEVFDKTLQQPNASNAILEKFEKIGSGGKSVEISKAEIASFMVVLIENFSHFAVQNRCLH